MATEPDETPVAPENIELEATAFSRAAPTARRRRITFRPLPIAIAFVFALLALASVFMFTARAVKFDVTPTPESVEIASGLFSYRLGERFLMLPGDYTVRVRAEGYHELTKEVTVGNAADQVIDLTLAPLPGILVISTSPVSDIEVLVDQASRGTTPLTIDDIEPGLHDIELRSERYLPFQTDIEIEGRRVEQTLTATLSPAWAEVSITSAPPDADVLVDGEVVGTTPAWIEVIAGDHTIGLRKPGFKLWQSNLSVVAGEPRTLDEVDLIKSDGLVSITSNPTGVNVTIGERYRGQTPLTVALAPGADYGVLLSKAGYSPIRRTISVKPEQDLALNLTLNPVMGIVRLQVEPADSELFIDGQPHGPANQRLSLTATRHSIEIRKPGFATYRNTVTPQPGLTQQLLVTLQTEEAARAAAIPNVIVAMEGVTAQLIIPDRLKMGASRREPGRRSNEIEKDVLLTRAFYLGTHEVTNKAFKAFIPSHESGLLGRSLLGDDDRPVVNVSWNDAVRFCNWLSERNGLPVAYRQERGVWQLITPVTSGYRLPSEAEWAWAARYDAGQPTRFPWGDNMPPPKGHGNYADESAANMVPYHITGYNDTFRGPAPAGSFPPNQFGIHDLGGNVSEWVHDYYGVALERELLTDPFGPDSGDYHVIRGSNYTQGRFSELRWTFRDYGQEPRPDVGFRIARYVE
jgi:formylglycine-generating enzyme required for sulfatase activity